MQHLWFMSMPWTRVDVECFSKDYKVEADNTPPYLGVGPEFCSERILGPIYHIKVIQTSYVDA